MRLLWTMCDPCCGMPLNLAPFGSWVSSLPSPVPRAGCWSPLPPPPPPHTHKNRLFPTDFPPRIFSPRRLLVAQLPAVLPTLTPSQLSTCMWAIAQLQPQSEQQGQAQGGAADAAPSGAGGRGEGGRRGAGIFPGARELAVALLGRSLALMQVRGGQGVCVWRGWLLGQAWMQGGGWSVGHRGLPCTNHLHSIANSSSSSAAAATAAAGATAD